MEVDNENSSQIKSFNGREGLNNDMADLSKKRKLQAEHLGLPLPKQKCWNGSLLFNPLSQLDRTQVGNIYAQVMKGKIEGGAAYYGPETESVKDSNTFVGDSDNLMMSFYSESYEYEAENASTKKEPENGKLWSLDRASSSSSNGSSYDLESHDSCDGTTVTKSVAGRDGISSDGGEIYSSHINDKSDAAANCNQPLTQHGSHVDHFCSEFGFDRMEQSRDKEIEDVLYPNEATPNVYVLSSGRWRLNQDAQQATRKPTIDQEFEQYFSMLML